MFYEFLPIQLFLEVFIQDINQTLYLKWLAVIHTFTHWWCCLPCKVPTSTSGAVWDSVSCPRTLQHADQGNKPATFWWQDAGSTPEQQQRSIFWTFLQRGLLYPQPDFLNYYYKLFLKHGENWLFYVSWQYLGFLSDCLRPAVSPLQGEDWHLNFSNCQQISIEFVS